MKKLLVFALAALMILSLAACDNNNSNGTSEQTSEKTTEQKTDIEDVKSEGVMTYDEYVAADLDSQVVIEAYVQATQSWWDNKITVYAQDHDGAYFLYEMACSEEDATKLVPGTKIKVTGYKAEWSGEVEIIDATFEFVNDGKTYIAEAFDATHLLGTEDLIKHQNEFVLFTGMTVMNVEFKNGAPGDDIYVTFGKNGETYDFCIEYYLCGADSEVYQVVANLKDGTVVDVEGFLYWYNGVNTHITDIKPVVDEKSEGVMTYDEYVAADLDSQVVIEAYVQATQSWWDNKITVYAQDYDGAYFLYEMVCSEEDAAKLVPGTKIKVTGYKAEWSGEIEITDATFEFVNDGKTYIAEAFDATHLLGTEDLIKHQNEFVTFKGMTVEKIEFKNGEPGDDIYVTVSLNESSYDFCIERYLTAPETDVYKAVSALKAGDIVDIDGFLYWYNGVNTHITSVTVK